MYDKQTSKEASKQANKQANKQTNKQASKQAKKLPAHQLGSAATRSVNNQKNEQKRWRSGEPFSPILGVCLRISLKLVFVIHFRRFWRPSEPQKLDSRLRRESNFHVLSSPLSVSIFWTIWRSILDKIWDLYRIISIKMDPEWYNFDHFGLSWPSLAM